MGLESRVLCEVRLGELTEKDIANLTEFARHRLAAQGLTGSAADDATQRALVAILRGLESDQGGRMPRPVDVENKNMFLNYVRGAISSVSEAMGRHEKVRSKHQPELEALTPSQDESVLTPDTKAELCDLQDQLFPRLRAQAPRRLQPTIDAWEAVFLESDRIPARGHRKYVGEVRHLAKRIVAELGGIH